MYTEKAIPMPTIIFLLTHNHWKVTCLSLVHANTPQLIYAVSGELITFVCCWEKLLLGSKMRMKIRTLWWIEFCLFAHLIIIRVLRKIREQLKYAQFGIFALRYQELQRDHWKAIYKKWMRGLVRGGRANSAELPINI